MKKKASPSSKKSMPKSTSLLSPRPNSPTDFDFSSKKRRALSPLLGSPANISKTLSKISDLRDLVSSQTDGFKKLSDHSHSEVLKEIEASKTRISKRYKIQTQACMQLTEEMEKDFKKISDRISENSKVMKDSFVKIISGVQASKSRVSKVTIPQLAQTFENRMESLRSLYKISGTPISLKITLNQLKQGMEDDTKLAY